MVTPGSSELELLARGSELEAWRKMNVLAAVVESDDVIGLVVALVALLLGALAHRRRH